MVNRVFLKDYVKVFFDFIKDDKKLLLIAIVYGTVASVFNIVLPLSIQYISSQIIANASVFPIFVITFCLAGFLIVYSIMKVFQLIAFSYFEKRIFIKKADKFIKYLDQSENHDKSYDVLQSYTEVLSSIRHIENFIFTTSILIQQFILGLIVTAFYHVSFLVFNLVLFILIFFIFKIFFFKSLIYQKKEMDIRYSIGRAINEKIECKEKDVDIKPLLNEYYYRKTNYFGVILTQNILFLILYVVVNCAFLLMSGFLTLKGYITIPQFLASEVIFSLVFATLGEFAKNLKNIYSMLNTAKKVSDYTYKQETHILKDLALPRIPAFLKNLIRIVLVCICIILIGLFLVPWYQTSQGNGRIIAYKQDERPQDITAMVSGRITRWYVQDGHFVTKGSQIAEISDNDPDLMFKLESEVESVKMQFENAKLSTETSQLNYNRQHDLYKQGLTARKEFEKAKIEYQKNLAYQNEVKTKLIQTDVKLARQRSQIIVAPHDGYLMQSKSKSTSSYVYAGEVIATFVPQIKDPTIEAFVSPNDIPLIHSGRKVRIQIEGWPALRISGWPSTALGTFGGVVSVVDSAVSYNGMFRVFIVPDSTDSPWPDMKYIKQGTKTIVWIRMNRVSVGYEIWRQINGFPMQPDEPLYLKKSVSFNSNEK